MHSDWNIRDERVGDADAIAQVHCAAFGGGEESKLVGALRTAGKDVISLVAEVDARVVGHVDFSPVSISGLREGSRSLGLAPLGVRPEFQGRGIGASLVHAGLDRARALGCDAVVVLGSPRYYSRFGFKPALDVGLACEFGDVGEHFMALELKPGSLKSASGIVRYAPEFSLVT